jgi:fido (protein-threonine AMPylation protein)
VNLQVAAEVVSKFSGLELHEVRVNHRQLLNAIWAWAGVKHNERHNIAQVNNFKFEKIYLLLFILFSVEFAKTNSQMVSLFQKLTVKFVLIIYF